MSAENDLLDRLLRRQIFRRNGVPEGDLPPVPAELLAPADWNLLPRPTTDWANQHPHPWPEPDCAECQSLATTQIPERPKEGTHD